MQLPVRQKLPHAIPQWVSERSFFFITVCCVKHRINQLCQEELARKILSTIQFYHEHLRWHCRLFLLMPDHVHGIVAFPREPGMSSTVSAWKGYVRKLLRVEWQDGFFDHRLRDQFELDEKTGYVLNNPVRAGLCKTAAEWPYLYRPNDRPQ